MLKTSIRGKAARAKGYRKGSARADDRTEMLDRSYGCDDAIGMRRTVEGLSQVYPMAGSNRIDHLLVYVNINFPPRKVTRAIDQRGDAVEPGLQNTMEPAESLYNDSLGLAHNVHRIPQYQQGDKCNHSNDDSDYSASVDHGCCAGRSVPELRRCRKVCPIPGKF